MNRRRRLVLAARRVVLAAGYAVVMIVVALGSAGIVALWSHPPGTAARAELTWHGDRAVTPALEAAEVSLVAIAERVNRLGVLARAAVGSLTAEDPAPLADALAEGADVAAAIETASSDLRAELGSLPGAERVDAITYSTELFTRRAVMLAALESTEGLARSWATLTARGLQAATLLARLDDHDVAVGAAAGKGRVADYEGALTDLAAAIRALEAADALRDRLENVADVSTLDEWIARNRNYDEALTALYGALRESGGLVNDAVRDAYRAESDARALLPPDRRGLVVIIADVGRGGLNQAVIAIEQARGRLNLALEELPDSGDAAPDAPSG